MCDDSPTDVNLESISLFIASWIVLLSDSPLNPEMKPLRLYQKFLNRISQSSVKSIVLDYSSLSHKLVEQHSLMGSGSLIGHWIPEFKDTPVFHEYIRYYKTGDANLLSYIYTFLNFGKKLEYVDASFEETAFRGWVDIENKLNNQQLDTTDVSSLKKILSVCLPRLVFDEFWPKFGPGSVSERGVRGRIAKLENLGRLPLVERFILRGHLGSYGLKEDIGMTVNDVISYMANPSDSNLSSEISLERFVPKNLKVARSIGMEPNTVMLYQQAVMRQVLKLIRHSPFRRFIDIKDQTKNQLLSEYGSYTGDIDTIDLSAASDSLSYELMKRIFPPSWVIALTVTRSRGVKLPNGDVHHLRKFAPMGSALCFPIQCIVFCAVSIYAACLKVHSDSHIQTSFSDWLCEASIKLVIDKFNDRPKYSSFNFQPLSVYGDDICIDGKLTGIVKSILTRLSFQVNDEKSFVGSQAFRESCGKFYMNGRDITPLFFRIKRIRRNKLTGEHVASHVSLINKSWEHGYRNLYSFLSRSLMTWGIRPTRNRKFKNPIPYVSSSDKFGIICRSPVNSHLQTRISPCTDKQNYQRTEYRVLTISYDYKVKSDASNRHLLESYEYMRWWASRESSSLESESSHSTSDTGGARVVWRWMPLY